MPQQASDIEYCAVTNLTITKARKERIRFHSNMLMPVCESWFVLTQALTSEQ